MICGLLGRKLGHSYSPAIHGYLADYTYELFEREPDELCDFLKNGDFTGINVTIPYKKDVAALCDKLTDRAQKLRAVNTVMRCADGTLIGHNTDYFGFQSMVAKSGLNVLDKKVLVLGSGGASVTAVNVLQELGARVIVISRSGENNYSNLSKHADTSVIVNTTPVGMYPQVGVSPIDLDLFPNLEGVLDVVYNPARTQLLLDAEKRGLITENGLWMLVAQAKESAEWFSGQKINNDQILRIHTILRRQMENIILIGMPGCGKSTIGLELASNLGKKFVDADAEIERRAGESIPTIFTNDGESGFRRLECDVLADLGKESSLVIATGGGCVTVADNYRSLHQNGRIFWIERDISELPTDGRPLSNKDKLAQMYAVRKPMYDAFADKRFVNNGTIPEIVAHILSEESV